MNIIYKYSDINENELLNVLKLWNDEVGCVYPISEKGFYQSVINYDNKQVLLAYDDNKLVGFMILKQFSDELLPDYEGSVFISLFFVSSKYRKNGIGSTLLDLAREYSKGKRLVIGKDILNFFPGVPTDFDNLTDVWLWKRGFEGIRYTHDLISYNPKVFEITNEEITYTKCDSSRSEELISFMKRNNWKRWAVEAKYYFDNKNDNSDNDAYLIGLNKDDTIISFVRVNTSEMNLVSYNVMWQDRFEKLGGIGPLGVDVSYRKQGIGKDMMSLAISNLQEKGCKTYMIDWTGLMELYRKFNFEVWKSYKYIQEKLKED